MKKTCVAVTSLLLMILYSPLARADEGLPTPIVVVTNVLQLSPDQTAALVTMIQTRDAALQPIAAAAQADQEALNTLLASPSPDPAAVGRLVLEIRGLQQQASTVAQQAAATFAALLTPDQLQRMQFVTQASQIEPAIPAFKAVGLL